MATLIAAIKDGDINSVRALIEDGADPNGVEEGTRDEIVESNKDNETYDGENYGDVVDGEESVGNEYIEEGSPLVDQQNLEEEENEATESPGSTRLPTKDYLIGRDQGLLINPIDQEASQEEFEEEDLDVGGNLSPLGLAIYNQDYDIVSYLLDNGANVNGIEDLPVTKTPIFIATKVGDLDIIQLLIDAGLDIKDTGTASFVWACMYGSLDLVQYFIDAGVDLYIRSAVGYTPLEGATVQGRGDVVELLLLNNGVSIKGDPDCFPIAVKGNLIQIAQMFINNGVEFYQDYNLLSIPVQDNNLDMLYLLLGVKEGNNNNNIKSFSSPNYPFIDVDSLINDVKKDLYDLNKNGGVGVKPFDITQYYLPSYVESFFDKYNNPKALLDGVEGWLINNKLILFLNKEGGDNTSSTREKEKDFLVDLFNVSKICLDFYYGEGEGENIELAPIEGEGKDSVRSKFKQCLSSLKLGCNQYPKVDFHNIKSLEVKTILNTKNSSNSNTSNINNNVVINPLGSALQTKYNIYSDYKNSIFTVPFYYLFDNDSQSKDRDSLLAKAWDSSSEEGNNQNKRDRRSGIDVNKYDENYKDFFVNKLENHGDMLRYLLDGDMENLSKCIIDIYSPFKGEAVDYILDKKGGWEEWFSVDSLMGLSPFYRTARELNGLPPVIRERVIGIFVRLYRKQIHPLIQRIKKQNYGCTSVIDGVDGLEEDTPININHCLDYLITDVDDFYLNFNTLLEDVYAFAKILKSFYTKPNTSLIILYNNKDSNNRYKNLFKELEAEIGDRFIILPILSSSRLSSSSSRSSKSSKIATTSQEESWKRVITYIKSLFDDPALTTQSCFQPLSYYDLLFLSLPTPIVNSSR